MRYEFIIFSIISILVVSVLAFFFWPPLWYTFFITGPIIILGFYDMFQKKHAIMRNYPVVGRTRYWMEDLRPKVYQYFIESDLNGRPFNRLKRSIVYQRAKKVMDTNPFGTQLNVYEEGYEWLSHSVGAIDPHKLLHKQRFQIGGPSCKYPYEASILNVSAMSFGSLSKNAVMALNGGAKIGNFAQNTGEGGISPYHLTYGGDLIFQFGTGYFGCRTPDGQFDPEAFAKSAGLSEVKMIELKLSQGAKPGHGGILPARKNSKEISIIRGTIPGTDVLSPPYHQAFSTPLGLIKFIGELQLLAKGKPVGFKMCVGTRYEFMAIAKAMVETKIYPDFIAIDGGEGGTGAAPLEFSNSVGMPFKEGLAYAYNVLDGFDIKKHIRLLASGKILSGFDIFRAIALGADGTYSARAMMMATGCIQALVCNQNTCPTGVATQDPELVAGLVVSDKKARVANYHKETVESFIELMAATGIDHPDKINRHHIFRRLNQSESTSYAVIYPYIKTGCLLSSDTIPLHMQQDYNLANPNSFTSIFPTNN